MGKTAKPAFLAAALTLLFLCAPIGPQPAWGKIIDTVAGGLLGSIPALTTNVFDPMGVAVGPDGNLYLADTGNRRVRVLDPAGMLTTVAGHGGWGFSGDGGPAVDAGVHNPWGLAFDAAGNLYIADTGNQRIRKVAVDGVITTVAGNGEQGFSGDGGPATDARLDNPSGVVVDAAGNVFFTEYANNRVRKVDASGVITTVAGSTPPGVGGFSGDGGLATEAALSRPAGLALDAAGNLYVADSYNNRVRMIDSAGIITTVAGDGVQGYGGDGGPAALASLSGPSGIAFDGAGRLHIADTYNHRIRMVDAGGIITTVAGTGQPGATGDGGPAASATLCRPYDIGFAADGSYYIADNYYNRVRRVDAAGIITRVAGNGVQHYSGDGGPAVQGALYLPAGLAVDNQGGILIADLGNDRIRRVDPAGTMSTLAYNGSNPTAVLADAEGNTYYTTTYPNSYVLKRDAAGVTTVVAGIGTGGYSGDGGPAVLAALRSPEGLALDAAGNLYVAEMGNHVVRMIDSAGIIATVAGSGTGGFFSGEGGPATEATLQYPTALALDAQGNLYIADYGNYMVFKVDAAGIITRFAGGGMPADGVGDGGPATEALVYPNGVVVDRDGSVLIADRQGNRIRRVDAGGTISTLAGTGARTFGGDGGPAALAALGSPRALAFDAAGNLYVGAYDSNRVRVIYQVAADFAAGPDRGFFPLTVTFENLSRGPAGTLYAWDFGDGTGSAETSPAHTYAEPGIYSVGLTASVPGGGPDDTAATIRQDVVCAGYLFSADPDTAGSAPFTRSYLTSGSLHARVWATPAEIDALNLKRQWVSVTDAAGGKATGDLLHEGGGNFAGSVALSGLAPGPATATFYLRDANRTVFTASEQIVLVPDLSPPAPILVSATPGNGEVTLVWSDVHGGNPAVTGYRVYRDLGGASLLLEEVGLVTTYTEGGLANGQEQCYAVTSLSADGESAFSNTGCAVPTDQVLEAGVLSLETGRYVTSGNGRNRVTVFVPASTFDAGEDVVVRATVADPVDGAPLEGAVVELSLTGPETHSISSAPSDGAGAADAVWGTSAPDNKGVGGTAPGTYSAVTVNVTVNGRLWDGIVVTAGFTVL